MIYRKRVCLVAVVILVIFASVMLAFLMNNDKNKEYKGTLVNVQRQETVI